MDALVELLDPDAELVSPLSGRMVFRGREDLCVLLTAVYGSLRDWRWHEEVGRDSLRVVVGDGKVGPFKLGDAMLLELSSQGKIQRIRPHLRPWLGLTGFTLLVGPRLALHPTVILRALRGPR
ncbi:hypothetical protein AYO39_01035 [Actinobacteria bacterium SCGC AG-212-D09]|nr:hypothetical protein AYO39_01035 [Actinobacteria bacterium SCGC AG-212-D09]